MHTSDDTTDAIGYAYCDCNVWPIDLHNRVGTCGLCHSPCTTYFDDNSALRDEQEAFRRFEADNNKKALRDNSETNLHNADNPGTHDT